MICDGMEVGDEHSNLYVSGSDRAAIRGPSLWPGERMVVVGMAKPPNPCPLCGGWSSYRGFAKLRRWFECCACGHIWSRG